ncbi:MAG: aminotransferase class III-fold pyridoxal phosphate-dependent enzyme [candidate division NC10 bacterium]|nr:aminotransferase class III-fold pyridoxal phosphate-dependent enzyme [candidate division NC10 bacterium]
MCRGQNQVTGRLSKAYPTVKEKARAGGPGGVSREAGMAGGWRASPRSSTATPFPPWSRRSRRSFPEAPTLPSPHRKNEIAAVIVDPLANRMGFIPPAPGFLTHLREVTRAYGILVIFDEVISLRVGYTGAQGRYGGDPDLTAMGKIIGGGFPVGATGGKGEVMAVFDPGTKGPRILSGGTFSANPVPEHAHERSGTGPDRDRPGALPRSVDQRIACLSTPMSEAELDRIETALERSLAALTRE